jgi:hypothetical protein
LSNGVSGLKLLAQRLISFRSGDDLARETSNNQARPRSHGGGRNAVQRIGGARRTRSTRALTEGFGTADLISAKQLLDDLDG